MEEDDVAQPRIAVSKLFCCGWKSGRKKLSSRGAVDVTSVGTSPRRGGRRSLHRKFTIYHDADDGELQIVEDELFFFDAREATESSDDMYPTITTTYVKPRILVSMAEPETLLMGSEGETMEENPSMSSGNVMQPSDSAKPLAQSLRRYSSVPLLRRRTSTIRKNLEIRRVDEFEKGFPGQLTVDELSESLRFVKELKQRDKSCAEIVQSFGDIEEEPYTICRFMRATKFDADKMLERLEGSVEMWREAKKHKFYPDVSEAIGAPLSVILSQYPFGYVGNAKNGCPISYLKAGKIQAEGLFALTTVSRTAGFFWHQFMFPFKELIAKAQSQNPDIVRCEGISVIDLKNLSSSQMTSEVMEVIKMSGRISDMFPETLHCMLILNAPSWFSVTWKVIQNFIDARTAKKIEVYASALKGSRRLQELIDADHIPCDFGGSGMSTDSSILKQCGLGNTRLLTELLFLRRRGDAMSEFALARNEILSLDIYSRSASRARFSVFRGDDIIEEFDVGRPKAGSDSSLSNPCHSVSCLSGAKGPGMFRLFGKDVGDARHSGMSTGYFLVVASVSLEE